MIKNTQVESQWYEDQAQFLKVLTHPVRLAILAILRDGEHCVCHMEAHLSLRQSYISQQLMILKDAGIIQDRREGWNVFYHVAETRVFAVLSAVEQIIGPLDQPATKCLPVTCNCPKCNPGSS